MPFQTYACLSHSYPSTIFPKHVRNIAFYFKLYPNPLSISPKQYTSSILSLSPLIFPTHACTTSYIKMPLYLFPENLTQPTFLYHRNSHNQSLYTNTFLTISTQITQMPLTTFPFANFKYCTKNTSNTSTYFLKNTNSLAFSSTTIFTSINPLKTPFNYFLPKLLKLFHINFP